MIDLRYLLLAGLCGCASPGPTYTDLQGESHRPLHVGEAVAHAVVFITVDCPIANSYAPAIRDLAREFEPRGVDFFLVHVDPDVDESRAREHAVEFGHEVPVLLDPEHVLVEQLGVRITPEVALLDAGGELVYLGRIDNGYAALGKKRPRATSEDLRLAIEALLAGRSVPVARTEAVGCLIPDRL